ncbi:hypothetical protein RQP46_003246 [Phenoliferia psychrophenolica]
MTSEYRHELPLREGLGQFRKVRWVQKAVKAALLLAYGIGIRKHPKHTTHVLRIHFSFNFKESAIEDQFTFYKATLESHSATAKALDDLGIDGGHSANDFCQVELRRLGGSAIAALPPDSILMPIVFTASFGDEVLHITKKRRLHRWRRRWLPGGTPSEFVSTTGR